jgi:hypothetical protein
MTAPSAIFKLPSENPSRRCNPSIASKHPICESAFIFELSSFTPGVDSLNFDPIPELPNKMTVLLASNLNTAAIWDIVDKIALIPCFCLGTEGYSVTISFSVHNSPLIVTSILRNKSANAYRVTILECSLVEIAIRKVYLPSTMWHVILSRLLLTLHSPQ